MSLQTELSQGELRAINESVVVSGIAGLGGVAIGVAGTFSGTVTFEGQITNAGTWTALNMVASNGSSTVTTTTGAGLFIGSCVGLTNVRARMSAFTSGIAAISIQASLASAGGAGGGGASGTVNQGAAGVDPWLVTGTLTIDPTGLATSAKQDTGNTSLASIDSKTPSLGQQLAAASSPVVLTAAQISTLTPPAAITNFALETGGHLATVDTSTAATAAVEGTTAGAAVITDANGTIQQYLRGLVKLAITSGSWLSNITQWGSNAVTGGAGNVAAGTPRVTLAADDPAVAVLGATGDAAVTAGATGSISAKLRSISRDLVANIVLAAGANLIGLVGRKNTYAAKATITITLTSLANGSKRESTAFMSASYADYIIRAQTKGQSSGTTYVNVYVYEALGDTVYTGNATGSDAAYSGVLGDTRYLGSILMNQATTAVQAAWRLSDVMVTVPNAGGLIFDNESGATLSATAGDHVIEFVGVN